MGWLFRRKKVPKVPFPEGEEVDSEALKFPERENFGSIEPNEVKNAAGIGGDIPELNTESLSDDKELQPEPLTEMPHMVEAPAPILSQEPLFVKVDVYQRILGEIGNLKDHLLELNESNRILENSEYNEEANFDKLRRSMKSMHDRLLQVDKVLFKS